MASTLQIVYAISVLCVCVLANWGHGGGAVPDVVKNLTDEQKSQIKAILSDTTLTKAQIKQKIQDWVNTQSQEIQDFYENVTAKMDAMKSKFEQFESKLSDEAKLLAPKIRDIALNDSLTFKQTCEGINQIASSTSDAVRKELHLEIRDCSTAIQTGLDRLFNCNKNNNGGNGNNNGGNSGGNGNNNGGNNQNQQ